MPTVTVTYKEEPGYGWFVVGTDVPDAIFMAGGETLEEARGMVRGSLAVHFEADESEIELVERIEERTA